jgi:hypothetical protein
MLNKNRLVTAATCKKFGDSGLGIEKVSVNLTCRNFSMGIDGKIFMQVAAERYTA